MMSIVSRGVVLPVRKIVLRWVFVVIASEMIFNFRKFKLLPDS